MAQKREKDETLEFKVPTDTSLSLSCPDNNCNKITIGPLLGPDTARVEKSQEGATSSVPRSEEGFKYVQARPGPAYVEERKRTAEEARGGEPVKRAVNRCSGCGKRVGLTGFRCRCGDLFCGDHRYSDRHVCSYDYKAAGREAIARENPVVRAAKILKV